VRIVRNKHQTWKDSAKLQDLLKRVKKRNEDVTLRKIEKRIIFLRRQLW